ncbi:MAG: cypA9 [Verrucomicrobiales bacterium]|nr:cypA9 [Verrucomicrobiales bacterium]
MRRNPFPVYDQMRSVSPVFKVPPPFNMWMVFDYENVKRVVNDHETFSSRVPAPDNWFLFFDPPQHSKLRALISRAFTPKSIASLEGRIRKLSSQLLDDALVDNELDLAAKYSVPLPMKVIAEMIGIPTSDWALFRDWSDTMLKLSYSMRGMEKDAEAVNALAAFRTVTLEMDAYLASMIGQRRTEPCGDLLTRLIEAEVDGEKLKHNEILGFFQLLIIGGQETTTNLINNSMLCFMENPDQLALLRKSPELLPSAIEEVLRYRSPLQWLMRTPKQDIALNGQTIPAGNLVLAIVGSANRDAKQFQNPNQFDITRTPNPHLAFGHGIHACLGAALSRMEARVALQDILSRLDHFELVSQQPWEPRKALHVHGPAALPLNIRIR